MRIASPKVPAWRILRAEKKFILSDEETRFVFYEKLYFHEMEMREKLHARVGISLTIVISLLGAIAYLWQSQNFDPGSGLEQSFYIAFIGAICLLFTGAVFLVRSFWGHTYSVLPSSREVEDYRNVLVKTYEEFIRAKQLSDFHFKEFVLNYLIDRATQNYSVNHRRTQALHHSNTALIAGAFLVAVTALVFFAGMRPKSPAKVELVSPVTFQTIERGKQNGTANNSKPPASSTATAASGNKGGRENLPAPTTTTTPTTTTPKVN